LKTRKKKIKRRNQPVFEKEQLDSLDDILCVIGAHFVITRCAACGFNKKILDELNVNIGGIVDLFELNFYAQNFIRNPKQIH